MLDSLAHDWLSRLQSNGARVASLALAALIGVELVRITVSVFGGGPVKSPEPVVANTAVHPPHPGFDPQSVVSAHLFGIPPPPDLDPSRAPPTQANLVLAGTIATSDPKRGVAIISDGGPAKVYAVGDNIGGAALHSVYLDHVILDRAGTLETLQLLRLLGPGMNAPPVVRRFGGDAHTVAAVEDIRRRVQQDPGLLDQVMRTVPSYDSAAGKLRGFRAYPGRNRQIFNKLGLRPGDLVTAINGTALDDPQRSQEVFNTIQTSDHVTVTVERGGQKQEISLNIAQVAAQATRELDGEPNSAAGAANGAAQPPPVNPPNGNENPNE
jgi:general secretion pathway protein C